MQLKPLSRKMNSQHHRSEPKARADYYVRY